MKALPLFDNILIKKIETKKKSPGSIVMPESKDNSESIEGEVIAVGPGKTLPILTKTLVSEQLVVQPVVVYVGQHVVFKRFTGTEIKVNGEKFLLVNQNDLQAIIDYEG